MSWWRPRFGVAVRKAGLYLIALYPMPFVDLTEADLAAPRHARITISLAGIVVDVTIGLLAFVAWHFTAGSYAQTLLGNVVVFSTLNSILFNGNPLIKLDGYFALTDLIGQRNLYSRSSAVMGEARKALMSLGRAGTRLRGAGQWGMLGYGTLAFLYRLNIIVVIASAMLPRHLGLGAVLVAWGGFAMFASPLLRDPVPQAPDRPGAGLQALDHARRHPGRDRRSADLCRGALSRDRADRAQFQRPLPCHGAGRRLPERYAAQPAWPVPLRWKIR